GGRPAGRRLARLPGPGARECLETGAQHGVLGRFAAQMAGALLGLFAQARRALLARYADHPARPRPGAEQLAEAVRQVARRRLGHAQLDAAGLEMDEVAMRPQMRAQHRLAVMLEQRDHLDKALRL